MTSDDPAVRRNDPPETPTIPTGGGPLNDTQHMTLPERHQTALRHVHILQGQNAKLYEDNCRLVAAINTLNDRLAFLAAPQNAQVLRLSDLQEKLRASEANHTLINRKYQELLQCASAGSAQHHIVEELQATRDAYASLDREFRLLADKYARLLAIADATRVTQQQLQTPARGLIPIARPEFSNTTQFRTHDQTRNSYPSPASAISPLSFQPFLDQKGNHRRRSSESVMVQPSLRSAPTPVATTWIAPLPTPPPSAPLSKDQISPTGFPVHASLPAASLPHPHHPQIAYDSRTGLSSIPQSRPLVQCGASEQVNEAIHPRQCCGETVDKINGEPHPYDKQTSAPPLAIASPRPPKRPSSELQIPTSLGELKKPRIGGEAVRSTTIDIDTASASKILSPPSSTVFHEDPRLSVPDSSVRSYQDCVNLIFEKDADVENGVFCGLCLDRHEAKMIPEPPDVLVQPDFDLLVRHCMTEHPAVWDDLRRKA